MKLKSGQRGVMSFSTWSGRVAEYARAAGKDPNALGVYNSMRSAWLRGLTPKQAFTWIWVPVKAA